MSRVALVALLLTPAVASSQDMPLFTFTKPGEGWVKAKDNKPEGNDDENPGPLLHESQRKIMTVTLGIGTDRYTVEYDVGVYKEDKLSGLYQKHPRGTVKAYTRTADKGTVYVGFSQDTAVWAFTPNKDNKLVNGAPYAPLRVRKAYDNSKQARDKQKANPPLTTVTALSLDSAGRLYAATEQDLQVFDPTGRLSGVLTLPDKGKVESMAWEGKEKDTLAVWVGEQKWTRKMNPSGR